MRGKREREAPPDDKASSKRKKRREEDEEEPSVGPRESVGLDEEIVAFASYVSLTAEEARARQAVKRRVWGAVCEVWPHASMNQFGSHATGLEWFESDMDLRVTASAARPASARSCVELGRVLRSRSWAKHLETRPQARVPIVCFRDAETDVDVDVSFEDSFRPNDSAGCDYFHGTHAFFRHVVLVLKALLKDRGLDKPFTGGLGSFRLSVLVDHFFKVRAGDVDSPGDALRAFLEYCCVGFNCARPILVVSADRRKSLRVTFGNVNAYLLRATCAHTLKTLARVRAAHLPAIFTASSWATLRAERERKIDLARRACRKLSVVAAAADAAATPPQPRQKKIVPTSRLAEPNTI